MKYFVSLFVILMISSGCCVLRVSDLTPFPPAPKLKVHESDPVISYDKKTKSYVVTDVMIDHAVKNRLYLEEIEKWRKFNAIP